jgi:hypothetical protein
VSTWTKSAAMMPRAWAVRNCFQVGPARRRGADPGVVQDLPDRGSRDRVSEPDELALHPPVPPCGVLRRDADHQLSDRGGRGWPSGTAAARVVPFACDQLPVPGEQRRRGHREDLAPPATGNQSRQRREPQPVARLVANPATWRRKTAFSCRRTKSSASLDSWPRDSTVRQPSRQRTSRQTTEMITQR